MFSPAVCYGAKLPAHMAQRHLHDDRSAQPRSIMDRHTLHADHRVRGAGLSEKASEVFRAAFPRLHPTDWKTSTCCRFLWYYTFHPLVHKGIPDNYNGKECACFAFRIPTDRIPINLLKPNDIYICRTAALTSRRYILNIYSTNIHTEYFKHAV